MNPARAGILIALVLVIGIVIGGCSRPALTEDDTGQTGPGLQARLPFSMVNAGFWTNGTLRSDRISLSTDDFSMLFVYLPESGLYIVTVERTEGGQRSGHFIGGELVFSAGRTEIRFLSEEGFLFQDGEARDAWVEFLPGFKVGDDAQASDVAIVGLARQREHLPGF